MTILFIESKPWMPTSVGSADALAYEVIAVTFPYQRTLSIVETERFLSEISRNPELPRDIRDRATRLLRHYPSSDQIFSLGRLEEWLKNDEAGVQARTRLAVSHQPLFCSSLDSSSHEVRFLARPKDTSGIRSSAHQRAVPNSDGSSVEDVACTGPLARVRIRAAEVFSDDAIAAAWLAEPNAAIGGVSPESLCATQTGARQVLRALNAIEWGGVV
jgi:uncharacterized protein (DUF2384 family)